MMISPLELFQQQAAVADVVEAATRGNGWSLQRTCDELLGKEGDEEDLAYASRVAKRIIDVAEGCKQDPPERAFDVLARGLREKPNPFTVVTYAGVRLRVLNPFFTDLAPPSAGDAQIGLRVWEAGIVQLEWLEQHTDVVRGKRVLDLGAGCGLVGISCATRFASASVTVTDYNPIVLENLQANVDLALASAGAGAGVGVGGCALRCCFLDWNDESRMESEFASNVDVILGADLVYDPRDVDILVRTLRLLLLASPLPATDGSGRPGKKLCLLASSIRNRSTFEKFSRRLGEDGLGASRIPLDGCTPKFASRTTHMFDRSWDRANVELYSIEVVGTI